MDRRPVGVEGLRTEHCHGGVFLNLGAAVLFRVPAGEIVSRIAGNRKCTVAFTGRQRLGFVRFVQRTAVGVKGHRKRPRNRAGNKVQLLVILILHVGIGVIREKVIRVVFFIIIRKCHGVAGIRGGDADGRAFGHTDLDGQRLAGGQIHIVGLAGNRVVLHEGLVSDPQLATVAGVDINAAAIAAGFVILDFTAIELADRTGAVNIYAAAVAGGRIAGDLAALHNQPRRLLIQIDGAAVAAGVSGDLAVIEIEHAVLVKHMNRAALLRGPVTGDLAAPHVERCRLIRILAQADGAAPAACCIVADLCAAGNIDGSPAHQNGAAVQAGGIAGDLRAAGNVDLTIAAHIDGAAAGIVAVHGRCIAGDGAAGHIDGPAGGGEECAAVLGSVILDGAAVHIESAAGGVRHVSIEFPENGTAVVLAVVAGDFTAVHIEYALLVIQSDGSAAAIAGDFAAGELAAEHIQRAVIKVNAGTAPDILRRALDGAAALTVTEDKPTAVFDLNLGCAVAGKGLAIQAQI